MNEEKKIHILKMEDVLPNRFQPRIKFDDTAIHELAQSIKEHGVIQPIVVRPLEDKYEIIAGERRYKASSMAGKQEIPAIITDLNDKESAEVALIENVQRQNLTPIEEAISYRKILDMGYLTQEQLAEKLGKSQSSIANKLRLLNLHEEVQDALLEGNISERHARSLLKLDSMEDQKNMLEKIIKERLTVRKADEEIDKLRTMSEEEKKNVWNTPSSEEIEILNMEDSNSIPEIKMDFPEQNHFEENTFSYKPENIDPNFIQEIKEEKKETEDQPSFMDIDRIEEEAKNISFFDPINIPMEKENIPNESIDLSLEKNEQIENNEEDGETKQLSPFPTESKFFNFGFSNSPSDEIEPQQIEKNNEFNFDFDSFFNQDDERNEKDNTNKIEEDSLEIKPEENIVNSWIVPPTNIPSSDNSESFQNSTPFVNENVPMTEIPEFSFPMQEPSLDSHPTDNVPEENSLSTYSIPDVIEKVETPEMELNNHIIEKDTMPFENEEYDIRVVNKFDIRRVTNKLREFTRELESMGYKVDTEEIDFEKFYQINIKIDK